MNNFEIVLIDGFVKECSILSVIYDCWMVITKELDSPKYDVYYYNESKKVWKNSDDKLVSQQLHLSLREKLKEYIIKNNNGELNL